MGHGAWIKARMREVRVEVRLTGEEKLQLLDRAELF